MLIDPPDSVGPSSASTFAATRPPALPHRHLQNDRVLHASELEASVHRPLVGLLATVVYALDFYQTSTSAQGDPARPGIGGTSTTPPLPRNVPSQVLPTKDRATAPAAPTSANARKPPP